MIEYYVNETTKKSRTNINNIKGVLKKFLVAPMTLQYLDEKQNKTSSRNSSTMAQYYVNDPKSRKTHKQ